MTGEMNSAQFGAIVGQVNLAHQPPMVRIFSLLFEFLRSYSEFSLFNFNMIKLKFLSLSLKFN